MILNHTFNFLGIKKAGGSVTEYPCSRVTFADALRAQSHDVCNLYLKYSGKKMHPVAQIKQCDKKKIRGKKRIWDDSKLFFEGI